MKQLLYPLSPISHGETIAKTAQESNQTHLDQPSEGRSTKRLTASLVLLTLSAGATMVQAAQRPNVLLIMADDMGYECLGVDGSTYKTPNLDKLAEKGMRFTNFHAQPLSTPTRVQLMTGLYNNRNYVDFGTLDPSQRSFGNFAREEGYKTCIAGKWQLGTDKTLPAHFGFDNYCLWQLSQAGGKLKGERYASPLYEVDGSESIQASIDVYGPDVYSDYICEFIKKNRKEQMFIYYPMALIHTPCTPTPDSDEWNDKSLRTKDIGRETTVDMVAYADKLIGKIITTLEQNKVLDNTLIIFLGDNGTNSGVITPMKDGSKYRGGKRQTKRNGTHVPMIAYWKGEIESGEVNENIADTSDIYPTLRDAMGGDPAKDRELDGVSFFPQLIGKNCTPRKWSFCHYPVQKTPSHYTRFAQTADYKLYSSGRFYNTRTDANETKNITSGTAEEEKTRAMLQKALDSFPEGSEIIKGETKNITL